MIAYLNRLRARMFVGHDTTGVTKSDEVSRRFGRPTLTLNGLGLGTSSVAIGESQNGRSLEQAPTPRRGPWMRLVRLLRWHDSTQELLPQESARTSFPGWIEGSLP